MLNNMKFRVLIILLLAFCNGCLGQKLKTNDEILRVLSSNKKDKLFSFNNSNKEYGKVYDYLKYLGMLKSNNGSIYKAITFTTVWGKNKHTINYLYIYDSFNHFVGKYKYLLKDELPVKIDDNKLVYFKREDSGKLKMNAYVYVAFQDGPPKIICPGCNTPDDGYGSEIIEQE